MEVIILAYCRLKSIQEVLYKNSQNGLNKTTGMQEVFLS